VTGLLIDGLSWVLLLGGSLFVIAGGIGVLRLPDVYSRSHAAGITDTLGSLLMIAGLMLQGGLTLVTVKLGLILIFLFFTSPTSTHALAHAAYTGGLKPMVDHEILGGGDGQGDDYSAGGAGPSEPS
jgi:multicomponent Na+:H+ antiporter subunit G